MHLAVTENSREETKKRKSPGFDLEGGRDPKSPKVQNTELSIHFERADQDLDLSTCRALGEGIYISRVTAGSPADVAGLKIDDKILDVNGHSVGDGVDLDQVVDILKAVGSNVQLKIARE